MRRISSNNGIARTDEQGSVIVELALTLPLLAILILGSIDMGVIVREHQLLQNAAREGARFSAQPANNLDVSPNPTATANSIRDKVVSYLAQENIAVTVSACTEVTPKKWNCTMTSPAGGSITIWQQSPIPIVVAGEPDKIESGSAVLVAYPRALLFPGGPVLGFDSVSLAGSSVFRNLY